MKQNRVDAVISELCRGIVPHEFTFNLEPPCRIDWSALVYNDWDHVDYWCAKQPEGLLEQFPSLFSWVEGIAKQRKGITPLMELEERK
jgi:hypothetical protein